MTSAASAQLSPDELALRLFQQELVAKFGLFALEASAVQLLLDEACRLAAEGLQTRFAKVLQNRAPEDDLLVVAGVGWHDGVVGHRTVGSGMSSPAGFALHTGQPIVSKHLGQEDRFRTPALLAEHGVHSAINVVIGKVEAGPFGVLEVDSTRRYAFVESDTAFLQALANVLAAALARAQAQLTLDRLVQDKDLLLREVHHRVSNSLQLVHTMIGLQRRSASQEAQAELETAAGRIMSIAAVHRRLYEGGSVQESDARVFLQSLLDDMSGLLGDPGAGRSFKLEMQPMRLSADALTPLGLIVSELVTNAIKYGAGRVLVTVGQAAAGLRVLVEDEGSGFGGDWATSGRKGLGMRLVKSLAKGDAARSVTVDLDATHGRVEVLLTL